MAVNAYLVVTLNDGSFLKSENIQTVNSSFASPYPFHGRPSLTSAKNPLFEIQSYSTGVSTQVTIGSKGTGAGKPDFSDLALMRFFDVATTTFFADLCAGKSLKYADLLLTKSTGGQSQETVFAAFGLGKPILTSLQWSGSQESPEESVAFAYAQLSLAYRAQNPTGGFGLWAVKGWDRTTNTPIN